MKDHSATTCLLPAEAFHELGFGEYTNLPSLPSGWAWIQGRNEWLLARDEHGLYYYARFPRSGAMILIRRSRATFWDWLRTAGALKPGELFADHGFTIIFPAQRNQ